MTGIRDVGLLLKVMVLGLAVSAAGLSLHLAVKIRWWRGFLFCLFCLCFVGYQLWPLARERIQLGLQPWYDPGVLLLRHALADGHIGK